MKKSKFPIIVLSVFAFCLSIMFLNACSTNPCADIYCRNNGTCREGLCACPSGFEGNYCQAKTSDKFIGFWDGYFRTYSSNGAFQTKPTNEALIISQGDKINKIVFYELYEQVPIYANIFESNKIDIPYQQAGFTGSFVKGTGYVEATSDAGTNLINYYVHIQYNKTDTFGALSTTYYEAKKSLK
jgi:EGF-like domain